MGCVVTDVLELLATTNPAFQLKTGTSELDSSERLFAGARGIETAGYARASHALPPITLRALEAVLKPEHTSLEIGGGQSTVVFAARVRRHICINPDRTANQLIREFLDAHALPSKHVELIAESSDTALPALRLDEPVDVALLDGNHSFPYPMIDWHYTDKLLRKGSLLVLDNVEINAVRILAEFLATDPAYRLVQRVTGKLRYDCFVFEKTADRVRHGWADQDINRHILARLFVQTTATTVLKRSVKLLKSLNRR